MAYSRWTFKGQLCIVVAGGVTLPADRQELLTELNALCLSIAEDECRCTYAEGVRFGIDLMVEIHGKDKTAPVILPRLDK